MALTPAPAKAQRQDLDQRRGTETAHAAPAGSGRRSPPRAVAVTVDPCATTGPGCRVTRALQGELRPYLHARSSDLLPLAGSDTRVTAKVCLCHEGKLSCLDEGPWADQLLRNSPTFPVGIIRSNQAVNWLYQSASGNAPVEFKIRWFRAANEIESEEIVAYRAVRPEAPRGCR